MTAVPLGDERQQHQAGAAAQIVESRFWDIGGPAGQPVKFQRQKPNLAHRPGSATVQVEPLVEATPCLVLEEQSRDVVEPKRRMGLHGGDTQRLAAGCTQPAAVGVWKTTSRLRGREKAT